MNTGERIREHIYIPSLDQKELFEGVLNPR